MCVEQKKIAGDESSCPVEEPEDMEIEETPKDGPVEANNEKIKAEKNEGKQMSTSSTSTPPIGNKPAKRRITPIAIYP